MAYGNVFDLEITGKIIKLFPFAKCSRASFTTLRPNVFADEDIAGELPETAQRYIYNWYFLWKYLNDSD